MELRWTLTAFADLSLAELYAILQVRQQVFVVEQQCLYQDCDGLDQKARHLTGWRKEGDERLPVAYLRLLPPGEQDGLPSIGRVLVHPSHRGRGIARELVRRGLEGLGQLYPGRSVRIAAQAYLVRFYRGFGFQEISAEYDEDGIPHLAMVREADSGPGQ